MLSHRAKALICTTYLLLGACHLHSNYSRDKANHPAHTNSANPGALRIIEINPSVYRGRPAPTEEARCKAWRLTDRQAEQIFKLNEHYDENPYSQFYQMSCVISGELIAEGKAWRFEIDGGGTAIWQREDEVRYWGCSTQACEPLVMLLTDFMQD